MKKLFFLFAVLSFFSGNGQTVIPSIEVQIKTALMAAPADKRDSATVYGYNSQGEFVVIRKGLNEMICLTDDPKQNGFSVACYHRDLDPFMARGRELKKAGKTRKEVFETRELEAKSGKLKMPTIASTLLVFSATEENYNKTTGEVKDGNFRSVVYVPYATRESTGLPSSPVAPGMPWLMDAGTHGAHIMITPPTKNQQD